MNDAPFWQNSRQQRGTSGRPGPVSPILPKVEAHKPRVDYKSQLVQQCELVGLKMEPEFKFHPARQFRADWRVHFAIWEGKRPKNPHYIPSKVLVEYEGGIFSFGKRGHSSITGLKRDMEKGNLAQTLGYTVIRVAPNHVVDGQALTWIEAALKSDTICTKCGLRQLTPQSEPTF